MSCTFKLKTLLYIVSACLLLPPHSHADNPSSDLGEMSIQQLINIQVTSVSKSSQKLLKSAAAIFVLTQDDIRRSGATSVAELMRLVPGLNVGRINSNTWGISSRGFNEIFANKLLVLIDGRTVYTPLFSGVFWDEQDVVLEDIERIEVIRGPGATLWGANAVNGVINIMTKDARDTVGGLVSGGGGSEEKLFGTTRYGAKIDDNSAIRVYGKYFDRDNAVLADSTPAEDAWNQARGGFRYDRAVDDTKHYTLQGDSYYGEEELGIYTPSLLPPYLEMPGEGRYVNGTNLLARVSNKLSDTQEYQFQMYYDRIQRADLILDEHRDTLDVDFQHRFAPAEGHDFIYGLGYRYYRDDLNGTFTATFEPDNRNVDQISWFLQDDMQLIGDELHFILGSKFEHNEFTGIEFQPNARLLWNATEHSSLWTAISRAARTPSRAHEDIRLNLAVVPGELAPNLISVFGNQDLDSEQMIAYETGFRTEVTSDAALDIAGFFNDYDDLLSVEPLQPQLELEPFPHGLVPLQFQNKLDGFTYGAEVALDWRVYKWWRFVGSYSYLNIELQREPGSQDTISVLQEDESPQNQFVLRNHFDLPHDTEFDAILRYNDNITAFQISRYFELDLRAAWRPTKDFELAVVGQNLLADEHREYEANFVTLQEVSAQRGVYAKATWRF